MSIADKLTTVGENVSKVYEAGKSSMVDKSKLIPKSVSGSFISLNDVSEIPHDISCKVLSKNLIPFPYPRLKTSVTINGVTATVQNDGGILIDGTPLDEVIIHLWQTDLGEQDINSKSTHGMISNANDDGISTHYSANNETVFIYVAEGKTYDNVLFYPQINVDIKTSVLTACGKNILDPKAELIKIPNEYYRGVDISDLVNTYGGDSVYMSMQLKEGKTIPTGINFGFGWLGSNNTVSAIWFLSGGKLQYNSSPCKTTKIATNICVCIYPAKQESWDAVMDAFDVQLEVGNKATKYEPFNKKNYVPNADGVVEGMTSISPYMTLFTNTKDVILDVTYNKSYGMQAEYDRFWDSFQTNGTRTVYSYAFAGSSWTLETFKPKYDINVTNGHYMFRDFGKNQEGGIDMVEICQKLDIKLDTSKCVSASYWFTNSAISRLGHMDFTQHGGLEYTFNNCALLETIEKITFKENGSQMWYTAFGGCTKLKNINAIDGVIGRDADLSSCPLSKQSIVNVVNALSTTQTTRTLALKKTAVNEAFGIDVDDENTYPQGSEFYTLRHSKDNWTFSYV